MSDDAPRLRATRLGLIVRFVAAPVVSIAVIAGLALPEPDRV